jgi:1-acyl-sn-glycerol-3-phosphate acyltransferase
VICFNHPSWLDPLVLAASWPDRERRLFIFGPREADMSVGVRNRLITWTGRGVPFKPRGADVVDATRRSVAVLRGGDCLAVAGEGRLSDREGEVLPLETGTAHLGQMTGAPVVPVAIIGTRWVHLGKRIRVVVGTPVRPADHARGRPGARSMMIEVRAELERMLAGVTDGPRPGPIGAWLSEKFNDRPWLTATDDSWR